MRAVAEVREHVPLAGYTTLGLGGPAARLIEAATDEEIISAVRDADKRGEPVLVLGGGSNLVVADEGFPGTVIRVANRGVRLERDAGPGGVAVTVAAGEDWDGIVGRCVAEGLSGVECLSGIPGLAGATPIQNVGAYGQEVAGVITSVRVFDRLAGTIIDMPDRECGFGYRTSVFKRSAASPAGGKTGAGEAGHDRVAAGTAKGRGTSGAGGNATGRFVVLGVTFRLVADPLSRPVGYPELAATLSVGLGGRVPLDDARRAVLGLRARKGMVLDPADPDTRSAGSFFTNPVLSEARFAAVEDAARARCGPGTHVPRFPADDGQVKVPAAWLIEHAGFRKGYRGEDAGGEGARISTKHTLALVNCGGTTTAGLLALAREIRGGVREAFGIDLSAEPVLVDVTL
jgi:UDP-N-acetylmuramate dehydrogenase